MPDPEMPIQTTPVETPLAPPPAPPAIEAVDDQGVPWKNRAAEAQRKLQEQISLNTQYQTALGRMQQPAPQPTQGKYTYEVNGEKYELDAPTAKIVERIAEDVANRTAHSFVGRAQMQQEASDPEILNEARAIYQNEVSQSPFMAQWHDDAKQGWAIQAAQVRILKRKSQVASQQSSAQALQTAASAQAQAASLPGTTPSSQTPNSHDEYIREYVKEWTTDPGKRKFVRGFCGTSPDSSEGLAWIKGAAEQAYRGVEFTGKTGAAIEHLTQGGR